MYLEGGVCGNGNRNSYLDFAIDYNCVTGNSIGTVNEDCVYGNVVKVVELQRKVEEKQVPRIDDFVANDLELSVDARKGEETSR